MLIAGPNLTIDRTIRLDRLRPGEVIATGGAELDAGGKGVNVARFGTLLGAATELVAFLPEGRTGAVAAAWLAESGVALHALPIPGEIRSAAILLEESGRVTVLNEPGPPAREPDWERLRSRIGERLPAHRVLVCTGSAPPLSPAGSYAGLVRLAAEAGALSVVDAGGPLLGTALEARPDLVTPNLAEAEELILGRGGQAVEAGDSDIRARASVAGHELAGRGAHAALVTAGRAGLALVEPGGERWLPAAAVIERNPTGAGDALVAGLAAALESGAPLGDAVLAGAAAAAATVEQELPGRLDVARVDELRGTLAWSAGA